MKKLLPIKMHLQKFAEPEDLDVDVIPVADDLDISDGEHQPVVIKEVTKQDPLNAASWQNVVTLMETQNASLTKHLEGVAPTLEQVQAVLSSTKSTLDKVNSTLENMIALQTPDEPEEIETAPAAAPAAAAEETVKKRSSGLRWK